jgi:hypothetical protein
MQEEKQDLEWGKFWARIAGGLALGAAGTAAATMLVAGVPGIEWSGVGIVLVATAIFGFMLAKYRRDDEVDRAIDRVTSVQAGLATIALIIVQNLVSQLGFVESEPLSVYSMPGFFILYKTAIAQYLRASLAESRVTVGTASLRP